MHPSMALKQTTLIRWTGRGKFADLRSSVEFVLAENRARARIAELGSSLVATGPEPIGVAALVGSMPGVSWVAAGMAASSPKELREAAGALGVRYLRRGDRFAVEAEATRGMTSGDLAGTVTSSMLEAVKGARVSDTPKVRFRAAFDGRAGVVGVEVKAGVGGVPTGAEQAACLVSGGVHSSVLAWMAMLQGFRVQLVHAEVDERSLRAVARLYSELSHRGDPRWLGLEVIQGGPTSGALRSYAGASKVPVFAGFHSAGMEVGARVTGSLSPLYLVPEETFHMEYEALGLKPLDSHVDWRAQGAGGLRVRRFGGSMADVSGVLDGVR